MKISFTSLAVVALATQTVVGNSWFGNAGMYTLLTSQSSKEGLPMCNPRGQCPSPSIFTLEAFSAPIASPQLPI
jgi:hypothetical protein